MQHLYRDTQICIEYRNQYIHLLGCLSLQFLFSDQGDFANASIR